MDLHQHNENSAEYDGREGRTLRRAALAVSLFLIFGFWAGRSSADDFDDSLKYLREQSPVQVGRDVLVEDYKRLIDKNPKVRNVADAILDLAYLLQTGNYRKGIIPRRAEALEQFARAASVAPLGSVTWREANIAYAAHLRDRPAEARAILLKVAARFKTHSLTLARVEHDLLFIAVRERKFDEAEKHCMALMNWYRDPARVPNDSDEKAHIDGWIRSAANGMITAWKGAPWPKAERVKKIQKFAGRYHQIGGVRDTGAHALKRLSELPEPTLTRIESTPSSELAEIKPSTTRFWLFTLNAIGLGVVGLAFLVRWARGRR